MGVAGTGQGRESALGTCVVGPRSPALPGPGLAALFPAFASAGVSLVKRGFLSGKREPRCEAGVGGLQASTREEKGGIEKNDFTVSPTFHKTAHGDAGDLPNSRQIARLPFSGYCCFPASPFPYRRCGPPPQVWVKGIPFL